MMMGPDMNTWILDSAKEINTHYDPETLRWYIQDYKRNRISKTVYNTAGEAYVALKEHGVRWER